MKELLEELVLEKAQLKQRVELIARQLGAIISVMAEDGDFDTHMSFSLEELIAATPVEVRQEGDRVYVDRLESNVSPE